MRQKISLIFRLHLATSTHLYFIQIILLVTFQITHEKKSLRGQDFENAFIINKYTTRANQILTSTNKMVFKFVFFSIFY